MSIKITVQPSGLQFAAEVGQNLLDAALAAKVLLPHSCRNGACSSCKAKVLSGDFNAGDAPERILSPDELAEGYTLLCQVVPSSDLSIESTQVSVMSDIQVRKMPSRIIDFTKITDDVMVVRVQLPKSDPFNYRAGQYLDFILRDGRRRSYSMACAPNADNIAEFHIRHTPGGVFTDHVFGVGATQLKEREIIRAEAPLGSFFIREDSERPILLLASGTGFAPIKAMVESLIEKGIQREVRFYWGGRRPTDLYMRERAEEWAQTIENFTFIPVVSEAEAEHNWLGRTGFVHHAVMEDLPNLSEWEVYACGAPVMVDNARNDFIEHCQLIEDNFYSDAFTTEADIAV